MTEEEIVLETIEYYTKYPRSVGRDGGCMYLNNDGAMCAFGRCMDVDSLKVAHDCEVNNPDGVTIDRLLYLLDIENLDVLLKPEYRGHSTGFWENLQTLHDSPRLWASNGEGLKEEGKKFVKEQFDITVE